MFSLTQCYNLWSNRSCERCPPLFIHCTNKTSRDVLQLVYVVALVSEWRTATSKCCTIPSRTNTSFTCMTAACCLSNSPTVESGLSAQARTICWTPGARRTVLAYFRSVPVLTYVGQVWCFVSSLHVRIFLTLCPFLLAQLANYSHKLDKMLSYSGECPECQKLIMVG